MRTLSFGRRRRIARARRRRASRVVAALVGIVLPGMSCARQAPCEPAEAATLVIGIADPEAPARGRVRLLPPVMLTELPLLRVDDHGRSRPGLARAWEVSADRRTWKFTIPERVIRQDGARLTTDQLKAQLLKGLQAAVAFDPVSRDIVAIEAPTPTTLVVRLARPNAMIPEWLRQINPGTFAPETQPGTGPYRLVRETDDRIEFQASPSFIEGKPRLASVRGRFYPSARAAWAAFLRRDVDMLYEAPHTLLPELVRHPDVQLFPNPPRQQYAFGFQPASPRLRDVRVRRALNMAIDRAELVRRLFGDHTIPASGPFSPRYWAAEGLEPTWRHDPVAARAELAAARGATAAPLELECLTSSEYPLSADLTVAIEAQLARINVHLKVRALPMAELSRRLAAGAFDTYIIQHATGSTQLWPYIIWRSGRKPAPFPSTGYTATDAAWDDAYGALDDVAERVAVRRIHDTMRHDPPAAFLVITRPFVRCVGDGRCRAIRT